MSFHSSHPLQPYWDLAAAPIQAQALESAIEDALFSVLNAPATARTVATKLHLNHQATQVWLDLLWSMALLVRHTRDDNPQDAYYVPSPLAAQFFLPDTPQDCAAAWLYRMRMLKNFASQSNTLLREGFDPQAAHHALAPKGSWAKAAREQIGQEQRAITVPAVMKLLDSLPPLPSHGNFLDVGGGPGHVAIALARRFPGWHGRVCDQDETVAVAQENIVQAGLTLRMDVVACDLNHHAIDGKYDLIWCSSVLHFIEDPQKVITHMASALKPHGVLLMAHAERSADSLMAAKILPFYTPVMLRHNYLPSARDIKNMLQQSGLIDIQDLGLVDFPLAPVKVYCARQS